jgi:hypothetical protein
MNTTKLYYPYIEHRKEWYDFYVNTPNTPKSILVVVASTYPNPLEYMSSIYDKKSMFDKSINVVESYYESRGIKVVISGPEGLGGIGADSFNLLVQWFIDNKNIIKIAPPIYKVSRILLSHYKKIRSERLIISQRRIRPKIHINLALYIDDADPDEDLIPYAQQLVISTKNLAKELDEKVSYAEFYIGCNITNIASGEVIQIELLDTKTDMLLMRVVKRLGKLKPAPGYRALVYKKGIIGYRLISPKTKNI